MKFIKPLMDKTVFSFLAAFIVSYYIYFFVRAGQLFPVPFYLKPCVPSGGVGSAICGAPDTTSVVALYVNIIFVWFIFFFFYICLSIYEIFKNYGKYQEKENVKPNQ